MKYRDIQETAPSDTQIIEEVLLGDSERFGILFDRYAPKVFGYLWHFSQNKSDCEDFLQDTFYKAYLNLKYCREREKFASWLFAIAHNVAVSSARRLNFFSRKESSLENAMLVHDLQSSEDLTLELVRQENVERVRRLVNGMPPKYKEVLVLFYYNESPIKEIATVLSLPMNTVKTRLHRARHYLMERLTPSSEEAPAASLAKANPSSH